MLMCVALVRRAVRALAPVLAVIETLRGNDLIAGLEGLKSQLVTSLRGHDLGLFERNAISDVVVGLDTLSVHCLEHIPRDFDLKNRSSSRVILGSVKQLDRRA